MGASGGPLLIDEAPLRQWVLKAYQERRQTARPVEDDLLEAIRSFLSGPLDGPSHPEQYFFEASPEALLPRLARRLDATAPGLAALVFDPLLGTVQEAERARRPELAPNLSVYVASLSGPIALKSGIDETIVCALLSTALLALARLGSERVERLRRAP
jgi:hypothetical protein